jgi:hypothetical protein
VTVSIRFDHGPDLARGDDVTEHTNVVYERVEVDVGPHPTP